jgi:glucose/arabinose dehydrogenase
MMYRLLDTEIRLKIVILTVTIIFSIMIVSKSYNDLASGSELTAVNVPIISDPSLKIELVFQKEIKREGGTLSPISSMAFLEVNDILLLNKNEGTVNRIVNGSMLDEPLLDVNVANKRERGMLGIAVTSRNYSNAHNDDVRNVFLYYTESEKMDGSDSCQETYYCKSDSETIGNHLYKYELKDNKLVNSQLLLQLPAWPAPAHNGGIIEIGPDNYLYITVGDFVGSVNETTRTKAQNYKNGTEPDGRAGILRLTQDGKPVFESIFGNEFPLNLYYAYGIRNSFGIEFDPVTHKLWDTENGPDYGDEINLVEPGFNSGWNKVQGIWKPKYDPVRGGDLIAGEKLIEKDIRTLVDFDGRGRYSEPEFTWNQTVGPSQMKFLNSDKFPSEYKDDLFVGDTNDGYLYHFELNDNRTSLILKGDLEDKIADNPQEIAENDIIIGQGFGHITDIEVGPDGYLYVLSHDNNTVSIFRILSHEI